MPSQGFIPIILTLALGRHRRSPLKRGGFFLSQRHPHREGTRGGVLVMVGGVLNVRSLSRRHCHLTHGDLGEALGNGLLRCRYSLGLEGMEGHTTLGSTANS